MCGIIGIFNKNKKENVNDDIIDIYQDQKSRGTEGFGSAIFKENKLERINRGTTEGKFMLDLIQEKNKTNMIIAHHRYPTSSDNKLSQTHPFIVNNKNLKHKYILIHNGVISNDERMYELHTKEDFKYSSEKEKFTTYNLKNEKEIEIEFNDSECLAIEMAQYIERKIKEIRTRGSFAFIIAQLDKKTDKVIKFFFGTNGANPIKMKKNANNYIKISSEGIGQNIKEDMLYSFSPEELKLEKREMKYESYFENKTIEGFTPNEKRYSGYKKYDDYDDYDDYDNYRCYNHHSKSFEETEEDKEISRNSDDFQEEMEDLINEILETGTMMPELIDDQTIEEDEARAKSIIKSYLEKTRKIAINKTLNQDNKQKTYAK